MTLLPDRRIPLLLVLLLFFIPLNVYVIGEWMGTGLQWALLRYQETSYGTSLITIARDIEYITGGVLTGKTAVSIGLWVAGVALLAAALVTLAAMVAEEIEGKARTAGLVVIASGILMLASCIAQYGPLLSGPAGFAVPVGIPLVLAVGWLIYSGTGEDMGDDAKDEVGDEDGDEAPGPDDGRDA